MVHTRFCGSASRSPAAHEAAPLYPSCRPHYQHSDCALPVPGLFFQPNLALGGLRPPWLPSRLTRPLASSCSRTSLPGLAVAPLTTSVYFHHLFLRAMYDKLTSILPIVQVRVLPGGQLSGT